MSEKFYLVLVCAVFVCLGCGAEANFSATKYAAPEIALDSVDSLSTAIVEGCENEATNEIVIAQTRRIIYNTTIGLVVKDYASFETQLPSLVETYGGFVANSLTSRRHNDNQSGHWVIRVPVQQYSDLLSGLDSLGFAESRSENAQDVTEEFVDIEARIKNKKALEARVIGILEDRSGKLSEILEIERELSRVREEIERMEGRLRFLQERSSLATITLECREEQEYQPATAPTFVSRITSAFSGSIKTLQRGAADLIVGIVALAPWMLLIGVVLWLIRGWLFRARKVVMNRS